MPSLWLLRMHQKWLSVAFLSCNRYIQIKEWDKIVLWLCIHNSLQLIYVNSLSYWPRSKWSSFHMLLFCNGNGIWFPKFKMNSIFWYYNSWYLHMSIFHLCFRWQQAVQCLIQGHELELAASVGVVLGNVFKQTHQALEYLSRRCEHLGKW